MKAATGEVVTSEELGGGEMHTATSGVADILADDDLHALALARETIRHLNCTKPDQLRLEMSEEPLYDPEEILGVVPPDLKTPYDVREVIARVVDGSRFDEFKARYGNNDRLWVCPYHGHASRHCCQQRGAVFRKLA